VPSECSVSENGRFKTVHVPAYGFGTGVSVGAGVGEGEGVALGGSVSATVTSTETVAGVGTGVGVTGSGVFSTVCEGDLKHPVRSRMISSSAERTVMRFCTQFFTISFYHRFARLSIAQKSRRNRSPGFQTVKTVKKGGRMRVLRPEAVLTYCERAKTRIICGKSPKKRHRKCLFYLQESFN
jgi:hypothetical protein